MLMKSQSEEIILVMNIEQTNGKLGMRSRTEQVSSKFVCKQKNPKNPTFLQERVFSMQIQWHIVSMP